MNKLKINRKHFVYISDIEKIVIKNNQARIYLKGNCYPHILKTTEGLTLFKKRLTNLYLTLNDFEVEYEN